jgi:hypothetical protein
MHETPLEARSSLERPPDRTGRDSPVRPLAGCPKKNYSETVDIVSNSVWRITTEIKYHQCVTHCKSVIIHTGTDMTIEDE